MLFLFSVFALSAKFEIQFKKEISKFPYVLKLLLANWDSIRQEFATIEVKLRTDILIIRAEDELWSRLLEILLRNKIRKGIIVEQKFTSINSFQLTCSKYFYFIVLRQELRVNNESMWIDFCTSHCRHKI